MTAAAIPAGLPRGQRPRVVATALLCLGAIFMWLPVLGGGVLWSLPMAAVCVAIVAGAHVLLQERERKFVPWGWVLWLPVAVMIAGLPLSALWPGNLGASLQSVGAAIAAHSPGTVSDDPWYLGGWLAVSGIFWFAGAGAAIGRPSRTSGASAFVFLAMPLAGALVFRQADEQAWQGAVVLAAALLWTTRGGLRSALPGVFVITLIGASVATALPHGQRWASLSGPTGHLPKQTTLDTHQTYGPQRERQTGATMFEVTASRPALWRMQTLDTFDGRGWVTSTDTPTSLPQPAATRVSNSVDVIGLKDGLVAAPGRVIAVDAHGQQSGVPGEGVALLPAPRQGERYTATSEEVVATQQQLASIPLSTNSRYDRWTQVWPQANGRSGPRPLASLADTMDPGYAVTPWGRTLSLARQLSRDAGSELEIVQRVKSYLDDEGRFKYTLDVRAPGPQPLLDFLLSTHEGYCQHFAGAAALLLRMAGVPTRVVGGFATGQPDGAGRWKVRDVDAHAWIEVYFPRIGWVPFDVTASGGAATVAPEVDPVSAAAKAARESRAKPGGVVPLVLLGLVALGSVVLVVRRLSAQPVVPMAELLPRLVPGPPGPGTTIRQLRPVLDGYGPAVSALADETERQRFGPKTLPEEPRPWRRLVRALVSDVGPWRALRILTLGPRGSAGDDRTDRHVVVSVAPPRD